MSGRVVALLLIVWGVFALSLALVLAFTGSDEPGQAADGDVVKVRVGGVSVTAEVAATDGSRTRGLAGHRRLTAGEGMLFVFGGTRGHDFWMQGVDFPLDMIWIRGDRVAGVTRQAPPEAQSGRRLFPSPGPIDRVLEVPGGWATRESVRAGDAYSGP
jgi:uncharacterized membrane protein (UPF0127 family)